MTSTKNGNPATWQTQTQAVRGGMMRSPFGETAEALYLTSGFTYDAAEDAEARFKGEQEGYVYSRFRNPTVVMFEQRLALIEGAKIARATATGMAAINAVMMSIVKPGDHIVAAKALFGSSRFLLETVMPRFNVDVTLVDGADMAQWEAAVRDETVLVMLESPTNPTVEVYDLAAIGKLAKSVGAWFMVDNAFASPVLQKPMEYGADIVVYSTTKHIDGQGRCMGGAILLNDEEFEADVLGPYLRNTGPTLAPFNAWVMLKGLETLELRMDRHCDNAQGVAEFLEDKPGIAAVHYPGLKSHPQHDLALAQMKGKGGNMVSFELEGGKEAAFKFLNALEIIDISNNLGDAKSLITHPTTTTHQRLSEEDRLDAGITPALLRFNVGLENLEDLKADLQTALDVLG